MCKDSKRAIEIKPNRHQVSRGLAQLPFSSTHSPKAMEAQKLGTIINIPLSLFHIYFTFHIMLPALSKEVVFSVRKTGPKIVNGM